MKKLISVLVVMAAGLTACQKDIIDPTKDPDTDRIPSEETTQYSFHEEQTVLGDKIEIPYSIDNLKKALKNLPAETKALIDESEIQPTHYYVRFHPKNEEELAILKNNKPRLMLSEVPLDREIKIGGTSYHDPSLPEDMPTYQYTTIEAEYWKAFSDTLSVEHEVLIEAYMPDYYDDEAITKSSHIPASALDALMAEAYRMTGNEYDTAPITKAKEWHPSGRIRAYDNIVGDFVPIKGVRVRGTHLLKIKETLTDEDGNYQLSGFKNGVNMKVVWESDRWDVRDGNIGQAVYDGPKIKRSQWNLDIRSSVGSRSAAHSAIHRAAYRYYVDNICGLSRPDNSRKEKLAYIHDDIDKGGVNGDYNRQWGMGIWSDIRIAGKNSSGWRQISELFSTTCHELGHATHYTSVKSTYKKSSKQVLESWATFTQYFLTRQEYKELGVEDKLCPQKSIKEGKNYEAADLQYNFQVRYDSDENEEYFTTYTPLFIDLVDDYNQFIYYGRVNPEIHPDDEIKNFPAKEIESIVFSSKSFSDVKTKLLNYATSHPGNAYNINSSSIDDIFSVY